MWDTPETDLDDHNASWEVTKKWQESHEEKLTMK